jgi:hypothetical protein
MILVADDRIVIAVNPGNLVIASFVGVSAMREWNITGEIPNTDRTSIIREMEGADLGLWGTPDLKRVAISLQRDNPEPVLGYIREIGECEWVADGDPENRTFCTPRKAAEHGYALLWRTAPHH